MGDGWHVGDPSLPLVTAVTTPVASPSEAVEANVCLKRSLRAA